MADAGSDPALTLPEVPVPQRDRRTLITMGAVLFGGLALTAFIAALLGWITSDRDRQGFEASARAAEEAITDRVDTSIALLRGAAGVFASQGTAVTVSSFRAYIERLQLRDQYPGMLGIGFTRRVAPAEAEALELEVRAQGQEGFHIWPLPPAGRAGPERPELHPIVFLEPMDERNRAAIGYDMFADAVRREAMEEARDRGRPAASSIVELVQELHETQQPGFLIYLPVYRGGPIPATRDERRERLLGFAYAPIRARDFLAGAFSTQTTPDVAFAVYHGTREDAASLLYQNAPPKVLGAERFALRSTVDVAGEPWTFVFRSRTTLTQALVLPLIVGTAGLLLTLLLLLLLWREASAGATVQAALESERAARSQAERANRIKDDFLATLSHELRTPLNAIVGWASVLRRGRLSEQQVRSAVDVVDRNAKAQARLIDDLLDMNRIISGKLPLNLEAIDPAAVVEHALAAVQTTADAKGVQVEKHTVDGPFAVRGDPARLQQVMANLLSNAIKFTPSGGRVRVALERSDSAVQIRVSDTGEGIEAEFLGHIFDRFAQADASISRRHGGLGLGLAIVRELVERHSGTVRAESPGRGQGATFIVELPLMLLNPERAPREEAEMRSDARLKGVKVLVVDDEPDARDLALLVLQQRKAKVHCAATAQDALAVLSSFAPDVLVSDIGMPGMNGYDLIRKVRQLPASRGGAVPAVAFTAYAREEDRREALRAGYQKHLVKPVRPEHLVAVVAELSRREG